MIKEAMRSKGKKKEKKKKDTGFEEWKRRYSKITEIAMIVSFVDSFIIDWLLLLLQ